MIGWLRTEYAELPLSVSVRHPRLSWILESGQTGLAQSAYRVLVASTLERLAAGYGDVWDTGRVGSTQSAHVAFGGEALQSGRRYHWQVQVWDSDGGCLGWSEPAWWEMGLLHEQDWKATWIGAAEPSRNLPLLRKEFRLSGTVERARIYVAGLGYYELHLNGERVGDHVLDPGFTDYTKTVLYTTYDVTDRLTESNVLGIALGRGWYGFDAESFFLWHRTPWQADPRLLLQLEVWDVDGSVATIMSDETWRTSPGPTQADTVFGESYDARKCRSGWTAVGYSDDDWAQARSVSPPTGRLRPQAHEPIRVVGTFDPIAMTKPSPGLVVYDMGQMLAGWATVRVAGPSGAELSLRYGEKIEELAEPASGDGSPARPVSSPHFQMDTYVLAGSGTERWEPRFSYKGFRYVALSGYPGSPQIDTVRGREVHSDVASCGEFSCSEDLLNRVNENSRWAILNNLHGIQTDTPLYEKAGWTGDAMMSARSAMYSFDMARLYTKWLQDFIDAQKPTGEVPPFVPSSGWGSDGSPTGEGLRFNHGPAPDFDSAYIEMPWQMYWHYGDERALRRGYASMRKYIHYLESFADNHILRCGLGDWQGPSGNVDVGLSRSAKDRIVRGTPPLVATAWYCRDLKLLSVIASVLGYGLDVDRYAQAHLEVATAFNDEFFDAQSGHYFTQRGLPYSQTANVMPLAFGLVPAEQKAAVAASLVDDILRRDGHLNTGIQGTRYLLGVLSELGFADVAYRVATQTTFPSWGYWLEHGATSLYENWSLSARSRNHHFFSSIVQWFYEHLAGIKPANPGFTTIRIKPQPPHDLQHARADIKTVMGRVSSSWTHGAHGAFQLTVGIPGNTTAEVHIPTDKSSLSRRPGPKRLVDAPQGSVQLRTEDGYSVFRVAGGSHTFTCRNGT